MTKVQLLKELHDIAYKSDDRMDQDDLFQLQDLIDHELIEEEIKGNIRLKHHSNGYIEPIEEKK